MKVRKYSALLNDGEFIFHTDHSAQNQVAHLIAYVHE